MSGELERLLVKIERRLLQRMANLFRRGEVAMANAAGYLQIAGYEGEQFDDVPMWGPFGLASWPPSGTEVLAVSLAGRSEEATAIACDSPEHHPQDIEEGEAVLYGLKGAAGQAQSRMRPDGTLALRCATAKFVEVGGADAKIPKGESLNTAINTWAQGVAAAVKLGPGPYNIDTITTTLAMQLSAALSTKGKVS